jgi:hypothetical protein
MADTTVKKVEAASSPKGEMGQRYLVAGKRVSMRLWRDEPGGKLKDPTTRDYETVGYVRVMPSLRSRDRPSILNPEIPGWCPQELPINIRLLNHSRQLKRLLRRPKFTAAILLNPIEHVQGDFH